MSSENTPREQPDTSEGQGPSKEFDDDDDAHDPEDENEESDPKDYDDINVKAWFEDENIRLGEKFGGTFIKANYLYSQPSKIGYYCQLCPAVMNSRKELEIHCNGVKHLKKKENWDKRHKKDKNHGNNWPYPSNHSPVRERNRKKPFKGRSRSPEDKSYDHDRFEDDYYWKGRRRIRDEDDRDSYDGRGDYDFESSVGSPRRDNERFRNRFGPYKRRSPPPPQMTRSSPAPENERMMEPDFEGNSWRENDGFRNGFGLYMRRDLPAPNDGLRNGFGLYMRRDLPAPSVSSNVPAPQTSEHNMKAPMFDGISNGFCNELLKNLSLCKVKNKNDAVLASSVANLLTISLKDYYSKFGPPTIVHILDEIILELNIVKDLQK